ncbi:hypothetical protein Q5P01_010638 [Channa striata]|uniref:Acyl-coenzyme A thioesterase 11 n=1 Tax=Channa striata TaxID=64152 RepID=A0AA88MSV8_CHASR|nr:hypothetical protein Q5P01_010638 [Channa striata]
MFAETVGCWKTATPLFSRAGFLKGSGRLSAHGRSSRRQQARRAVSGSSCHSAKAPPARTRRETVTIPGLDRITYGERMHFVPGLAKPVNPHWERDYKDPRFCRSPPVDEMPLYKEKPCHVFNQRTSVLEGVRQALWLTKTKVISGLPPQLLALAENPAIPDQDERVQNAIKHARFWDTTEARPGKQKFSNTLLMNLLHLCGTLQSSHPAIGRRIFAEKYSLAATWKRGEDLIQVRGQNGLLHCCMDPLPEVSDRLEVAGTADHVLETFYPVSPTIDLQKVHVYKEEANWLGFRTDSAYPHAHTLYFVEGADAHCKLLPEQFRAKMLMFSFGNALARAHTLYGTQPQRTLDRPVTVQAVGTNGRIFQFMVFQLNTTDLSGDDGIKNQVWLDKDVELYDFAKVRPLIIKKQVKVPAGLSGYKPETFSKFLALYLHGAEDRSQARAHGVRPQTHPDGSGRTPSPAESGRVQESPAESGRVRESGLNTHTRGSREGKQHTVGFSVSAGTSPRSLRSASKMSSTVSSDLKKDEDEDEEEAEDEEERINPTEVKMSQIVMPCHSNHRQELSVGQLLKWMDSTACLSAERHAGCPCVTASMDDIHFERTISVGQVVNIKAKVNRAFNTSMEVGIQVSCEDLFFDRHWRVCHAYATFVTHRTNKGEKVILKPIVPCTQKEQVEYSLAAERRRVRMVHDDIIKDLLSQGPIQQGDNLAVGNAVAAERTRVESVELVLPPHANHQVNTFGGQIMAWMVNVAMIAASRLCQAHPTLRAIDMFTFRGPSQVGDRLLLRAIVNNAFENSMEVGVRAEAYQEEGSTRHINSAFMTFEVLDNPGKPCTLPRIRPEPLEGQRRFQEAIARKKIRLDRKYIISCKTDIPLSVPWDPTNQVYLSFNNVSALKMLAARNRWRLSSEKDKVRLYTIEQKSMLSFRVEAEVHIPANRAFSLLAELSNRPSWDTHYQKCELIHRVDDDDFLYRVVTPSVRRGAVGSPTSAIQGEGVLQDFILLASKRKPCSSGDPYVIALRSVSLPTHPPTEGFNRGEVLCAGFTILESKNNMSLISYYNQASPEVLPYISTDIAGLSSSFYHTFCSCSQYLTKNRLPSTSDEQTAQNQATSTDQNQAERLVVALHSTQL